MISGIARRLDRWVVRQAMDAVAEGLAAPRPCKIRLLGQMALLETARDLDLALTNDVDVRADYDHAVGKEFERLLRRKGLILDPVGHEAWMPRETRYTPLFEGSYVTLLVADLDAVLVSKARMAPVKNAAIIRQYIARGASERFFDMARRYDVRLEQFV